jgi:ParB family chromosome partitioning protein
MKKERTRCLHQGAGCNSTNYSSKIRLQQIPLISGERRLRASTLIGLTTVPAYIANDNESLIMALGWKYSWFRSYWNCTVIPTINWWNSTPRTNERACWKKTFNNRIIYALLKLDPIIQTGIRDGLLYYGRAIINIEDLDIQTDIYQK